MDNKIITTVSSNLDSRSLKNWNQYLEKRDNACFYQLLEWQTINSNYFGHKIYCITAEIDNKLVGVLPVVSIKSILFGHILSSMPFVNYGSSCSDSADIDLKLIEAVCKIAVEDKTDYVELRSVTPTAVGLKEATNKISLTLTLDQNHQNIWDSYKSKHRTNIRRVYKNGITIRCGGEELLSDFYQIISKSWRTLGTPIYSIKYFEQLFIHLREHIKIFVAYKGDIPVAAALNGYYKNTVEGMWLGIDQNYRTLQPSYVLYWEMIKHACESGYTNFHLGRSSVDSGGESFKRKWNAETKQLYWQYYLNRAKDMPNLNPSNPKYKYFINMWSRMPLKATQLLGPLISKYIP
ncbi:MAG: FemAB family PEP-CTERM system-associated protein [Candidatus Thiodiazotropha sp. (ex Lucinoma borealis)]|nr:FemAB family PEP-CTERM system-associated protein [Candidatus Thiodiazotropha sp. (ex Lucinoma borealis)]